MQTTVSYSPIKTEYINPFIDATVTVFQTMLGLKVRRGALYLKDSFQPSLEITGTIGLSGMAKGSVLFGVNREVAIALTGILLGETCESIDNTVIDAIGELTNMIAGSAKAKLEELQMSIGLPTVVVGSNHTVVFPSGVKPIGIPFTTEVGQICLEVSLVDSN